MNIWRGERFLLVVGRALEGMSRDGAVLWCALEADMFRYHGAWLLLQANERRMRSTFILTLTSCGFLLFGLGCDQKTPGQNGADTSNATAKAAEASNTQGAAATTAKAVPVPKKESDKFSFVATSHNVEVGKKASIAFEIKPGSGLKINPEYPWKASVDGDASSPDVALSALEIGKDAMTLEEVGAKIPLEVTANKAGEHYPLVYVLLCQKLP